MAFLVATAAAAGILPTARRPPSANRVRFGCESMESVRLSTRLAEADITQLTNKFCCWKAQHGVFPVAIFSTSFRSANPNFGLIPKLRGRISLWTERKD